MKRQYLGDSKDSFKWDYHDYMVSELGYPVFNIALMMTPDDESNDGNQNPSLFPARKEIIEFCHNLRETRTIETIKTLPLQTNSSYKVLFHKGDNYIDQRNRNEYFSNIENNEDQLFFIDPDNGFEPERSFNEKHVKYMDVSTVLEQLSNESVISIFQHFRRISFPDDFSRIRERIEHGYSTAIYWHSLMFVAISKSEKAIHRIISANKKYIKSNPVKIII